MRHIGATKCELQYNTNTKTYTLRDINGDELPNVRAQIWEGVTLKSTEMQASQNKVKESEK